MIISGVSDSDKIRVSKDLDEIFFVVEDKDNNEICCFIVEEKKTSLMLEIKSAISLLRTSFKKEPKIRFLPMSDFTILRNQYMGAQYLNDSTKIQNEAISILSEARKNNASDIHIIVDKSFGTVVKYRINNELHEFYRRNYDWGISLLIVIYEHMADQTSASFNPMDRLDGRISNPSFLPQNVSGVRIATTPHANGTYMVMRLLYRETSKDFDLVKKGYTKVQVESLDFVSSRPFGINVISGPTGSGKSTTLENLLGGLYIKYKGQRNVITVEDPPEYIIEGAIQTPVDPSAETEAERAIAYHKAIKQSLRLDPDIIMIGELRDHASAKLAFEAAMTGHQVWTTLHANSALAILDRFIELGISEFFVYDSNIVTCLIAQRLFRKPCPHCKVPFYQAIENGEYDKSAIRRIESVIQSEILERFVFVRGKGCEHCKNTGISGRTACAEVVVTDPELMSFFRRHDKEGAMRYWRVDQRGRNILDEVISKIEMGILDPFMAEEDFDLLTMNSIMNDNRVTSDEIKFNKS